MAAPGEHEQAVVANPQDQRLVVEDERVGLPSVAAVRLVALHAGLERRRSVDLAGDQHRPLEEERRAAALDDVETGVGEAPPGGRWELDGVAPGDGDAAPVPELGVDQDRQVHPSQAGGQARQPGGVVEVAVAADDDLDVAGVDVEAGHVLEGTVRRHAGVEEDAVSSVALAYRHRRAEAVLGDGHVGDLA